MLNLTVQLNKRVTFYYQCFIYLAGWGERGTYVIWMSDDEEWLIPFRNTAARSPG